MRNVGRTPALDVQPHVAAFLRAPGLYQATGEQHGPADGIRSSGFRNPGDVVFPNDTLHREMPVPVWPSQISKAVGVGERRLSTKVQMCVVGVVAYHFPFGDRIQRQSGFMCDVGMTDGSGSPPSLNIETTEGEIPADRLVLLATRDDLPRID